MRCRVNRDHVLLQLHTLKKLSRAKFTTMIFLLEMDLFHMPVQVTRLLELSATYSAFEWAEIDEFALMSFGGCL
jgi:hypothetical protein